MGAWGRAVRGAGKSRRPPFDEAARRAEGWEEELAGMLGELRKSGKVYPTG
ncbi:MAG: hypothetical protein H5T74_07165 [Actinobacteria bacterium]|nr:hypothetical protein [Actinomycetota bacterium]